MQYELFNKRGHRRKNSPENNIRSLCKYETERFHFFWFHCVLCPVFRFCSIQNYRSEPSADELPTAKRSIWAGELRSLNMSRGIALSWDVVSPLILLFWARAMPTILLLRVRIKLQTRGRRNIWVRCPLILVGFDSCRLLLQVSYGCLWLPTNWVLTSTLIVSLRHQ